MDVGIRIALFAAGSVLAAVAWLAAYILVYDARLPAGPQLDAAIVLGAAAYGSTPSPVFQGRLDYGYDLLHSGRVRYVIVTGGGRDDPTHPESEVGVQYLLARGAKPSQVLSERRSKTTPENLCFALEVGRAKQLRSYAIVSDALHLRRALRYAADLGLEAQPAATPYTRYIGTWARLGFALRESYVYAKRLIQGPVRCEG